MLDKIDRYQIIRELGRGGMATVYLAMDPRFGREVAVKVLPSQFLHDPQFRARFTREAQTVAALEHPAIVPVYDFGDDRQPYIVMRYMSGGSLEDRIKQGEIPFSAAVRIIRRLADGLDTAHQRNIIHRDLKPANILFDQYDNAHLSDFGIVQLSGKTANLTGNNIIGTAAYMSPEQAQGGRVVDGRTDIYALGVVLFEMLSTEMPFGGDTPIQQLMGHITRPIPSVLALNPSLPPAIEPIIQRALAKEPSQRYPTAKEMARALVHVLNAPRQSSSNTMIDSAGLSVPTLMERDPLATQFVDEQSLNTQRPPTQPSRETQRPPTQTPPTQTPLSQAPPTLAPPTMWEPAAAPPTMAEPPTSYRSPAPPTSYRAASPPASAPTTSNSRFLWFGIGALALLLMLFGGGYYGYTNGFFDSFGLAAAPPTETPTSDDPTETPTPDDPTETPTPDDPTETPTPDGPTPEPESPSLGLSFMVEGEFGGGGNRIAFQSQQGDGTWTIWTMDLDGGNRLKLTDDSGNDIRPRWSPDGQWITFTSDRDGGEDMWMMRPDGSELQKLTTNTLADFTGAWSPDGEWLAYHADLDGVASILKMSADGSETVRMTTEADGHSFWPSWSPDGERLVFWTIRNDDKAEIWTMDDDGENQTALVTGSGTYLDPVWSPVSNEVAYYAYDGGSAEIFTVDADGGTPTEVETGLPASVILGDWSPDGEWMILHTDWHGADEIYLVRVDGSESKRLTNRGSDDQHAAWQPIGRTVSVESSQPATGDITIWHAYNGVEREALETNFSTFAELYPDVNLTVEVIENGNAQSAFENAADPPDILLGPVDWGGGFVADGLVQEPTDFLSTTVLKTLDPTALENAEYDGQLVGLPFSAKGILLFRNESLQAESPDSIDDILDGTAPFNLERGLYFSGATLAAQGGQLMDEAGNPTFNDAAGREWIELLAQFNDDASYGDGDIEAFVRGEVAMILDATWNIERLVNSIGASNLVIESFPEGMAGWVMYDMAYVSADATNDPAISAFLTHLVSAEFQTTLAEAGRVPVTDNATVANPFVEQAANILATNEPFPLAPQMTEYWTPLTVAIEAVAVDGADAAAALTTAEQEIDAALDR